MGRSRVIPYVIKIRCDDFDGSYYGIMEWRTKAKHGIPADGSPTVANISKWVKGFELARMPGGSNSHLGFAKVTEASIFKGGEMICTWKEV
jgi:hypothetical protein